MTSPRGSIRPRSDQQVLQTITWLIEAQPRHYHNCFSSTNSNVDFNEKLYARS